MMNPKQKQNKQSIFPEIAKNVPEIVALRRHIHAHPELSFEEFQTADLIANQLQEWGITVHRGLGRTGVVGIIKKTVSERTSDKGIGLRADMDALPMQEKNTFLHASRHTGKMHACGHDGHVAMLLAAAQHLARDDVVFDGTVYLIFQPAEEGGGGAKEMIQDGLFDLFPMQAVYGMHNWPGMAVGTFAASGGPVMASSNEFTIYINGKGGHAAMPQQSLDPIPVACQLVQSLQTIVSRTIKPIDAGVVSVTMIHAGEATNVIPSQVQLQGTVRTFSTELLDSIETKMRTMTHYTAAAAGMTAEFEFVRNYPPTINHTKESELARQVMQKMVGISHVLPQEPTMGAEDFAYMLQAKAGAYCFIGNGGGVTSGENEHRSTGHGEGPCVLHNASYDFNDELVPLGGSFWVHLVLAFFDH